MSDFLGVNIPQEMDIYSAGWSTRTTATAERFYSLFGNVPTKPTTSEIMSGISQIRKLHNFKETVIFRIRYLEHRKAQLHKGRSDIENRIKCVGPYGDNTFERTMTARVLAATKNIRRLHNVREYVIFGLRETEDQLRGLWRELRDIDRIEKNLMRRLGGIGDDKDVDDAVTRRLVDMEQ